MAGEFIGAGASIGYNTAAVPATYTTLDGATAFDTPVHTVDDIEVTALDSTGKEFIPGLGDSGTMTFNVHMRKNVAGTGFIASQMAVEAMVDDGLMHGWQVTMPAPLTRKYTINGYVKEFKISGAPNTAVTAAVVIRLSGKPVIS